MKHTHHTPATLLLAALLAASLAACSDPDDFTPPAFLHLDAINVAKTDQDPIEDNEGFYNSDIVAAYVVAHYPGTMSVDTIGLFRLPFTAPVLYNGKAEYIDLYPAVEHSGVSGTIPYYTFFDPIHLTDSAHTTLPSGDTLNLQTLTTHYASHTRKLFYSSFDHDDGSLRFDSALTVVHDPSQACTGVGYGSLHVTPSQLTVPFAISNEDPFVVADPTSLLYLELDTRSDLRLQVYMHSAYVNGGAEDVLPVMVINPSSQWKHLYINLGRTWKQFNYHPTFKISFAALNTDGIEGDIRIDNVKILTTTTTL